MNSDRHDDEYPKSGPDGDAMSNAHAEDNMDQRDCRKKKRCRPLVIAVGFLGSIVVGLIGLGLLENVQLGKDQAHSTNKLKGFSRGMQNYNDQHGALPPAAIRSQSGEPLLSWRVAILPHIEWDNIYQAFRLDEPWDSPHNRPLLDWMPKNFRNPGEEKGNVTHFRVFQGKNTLFEADALIRLNTIEDGASNTILIVEADEAVPWTKPEELDYDPNGPLPKLGGLRRGTVLFAMADGSVRSVKVKGNERNIRAAITRNGGEQLPKDW